MQNRPTGATRLLAATLLITSPWAAQAVALQLDNQLRRDGSPWTAEQARLRIGHDPWRDLTLQPGLQSIDVEAGTELTALLELQLPGRDWVVGSAGAGSAYLTLRGDVIGQHEPDDARGQAQGALNLGMNLPRIDNGLRSGAFLPVDASRLEQVWGVHCASPGQLQMIPASYVCRIDAEPQALNLSLLALQLPASAGSEFWGAFATSRSAADWIVDSRGCIGLEPAACPTFSGGYWFGDLRLDIADLQGQTAAQLLLSAAPAGLALLPVSGWADFKPVDEGI